MLHAWAAAQRAGNWGSKGVGLGHGVDETRKCLEVCLTGLA